MRCAGNDTEAHALEDRAVIGLGINLYRVGSLLVCHADEVADELVAQTRLAGGFAHGYALDDIALQTAASNYVAVIIGDSSIIVHILKTQTAVGKEALHLGPVGLERERHVADFKVIVHSR